MVEKQGISAVLVAVIILAGFATGTVAFIQGMNTGYANSSLDISGYESDFARLGEMEDASQSIYDSTTETEEQSFIYRILDGVGQVFDGFRRFIATITTGIGVATDTASNAQEHWDIPGWFIITLGAIISVTIATLILGMVFRKNV